MDPIYWSHCPDGGRRATGWLASSRFLNAGGEQEAGGLPLLHPPLATLPASARPRAPTPVAWSPASIRAPSTSGHAGLPEGVHSLFDGRSRRAVRPVVNGVPDRGMQYRSHDHVLGAPYLRGLDRPSGILPRPRSCPTTAIDPQSSKAMDRLATASAASSWWRQEEPVALRELGPRPLRALVLRGPDAMPRPRQVSRQRRLPVPASPSGAHRHHSSRRHRLSRARPVGAPPPAARAPADPTTADDHPAGAARALPRPARSGAGNWLEPAVGPAQTRPCRRRRERAPRSRRRRKPPRPKPQRLGRRRSRCSCRRSAVRAKRKARTGPADQVPDELGSRPPVVRRADLGSKGVYYRTMVGPFRSAQEASQFCAAYKAAGGQCVVPSNERS